MPCKSVLFALLMLVLTVLPISAVMKKLINRATTPTMKIIIPATTAEPDPFLFFIIFKLKGGEHLLNAPPGVYCPLYKGVPH